MKSLWRSALMGVNLPANRPPNSQRDSPSTGSQQRPDVTWGTAETVRLREFPGRFEAGPGAGARFGWIHLGSQPVEASGCGGRRALEALRCTPCLGRWRLGWGRVVLTECRVEPRMCARCGDF